MTKVSELLLNAVIRNRLKLLRSLTRNMGMKRGCPSEAMGTHGPQCFR